MRDFEYKHAYDRRRSSRVGTRWKTLHNHHPDPLEPRVVARVVLCQRDCQVLHRNQIGMLLEVGEVVEVIVRQTELRGQMITSEANVECVVGCCVIRFLSACLTIHAVQKGCQFLCSARIERYVDESGMEAKSGMSLCRAPRFVAVQHHRTRVQRGALPSNDRRVLENMTF